MIPSSNGEWDGSMEKIRRIIVPVDLTESSRIATEQGAFFAKLLDAEVSIINVDDTQQFMVSAILQDKVKQEKQKYLNDIKQIVEKQGVKVTTTLKSGVPSQEIVKHCTEEDLIVMASQERKGFNRLVIGSVSEEVLKTSPCSVMIIKPKQLFDSTESFIEGISNYYK